MSSKKVIIIGAGPAGITAAIQLKRADIDIAIFEKDKIGGLLLNANMIENYPGLTDTPSGTEMAARFSKKLKELDINVVYEEIISVEHRENMFCVRSKNNEHFSKYLIVATGTVPVRLEGLNRDIHYDIYPLLGITGKRVAVIGGGDAAFDYALNLAGKNNRVSIYFRRKEPTCLPLLYERALEQPLIEIHAGTEFVDDGYDNVLAAIGRVPCIPPIPLKKNGIYLAGDICRGDLRQLVIAAGDGMFAAQDIIAKENLR